jgi:TonB family protein
VSRRTTAVLLAALSLAVTFRPIYLGAQTSQGGSGAQNGQSSELTRRAKIKVQPEYPDLARKMNITGTVKVEVVVAPNGTVKEARVLGGHPVLASAAVDAARKWRFEPAATESMGVIDFKFQPQ